MKDLKIEFYETGIKDDSGREILENASGETHKMVDGVPHTVTAKWEPQTPIVNFQIISLEEQLEYDPGDYPDDLDPGLYGLEDKSKKPNNGLSI